jgi:hypothetical protein
MIEYQYHEFAADAEFGRRIEDIEAEHRRRPAFMERPASAGL